VVETLAQVIEIARCYPPQPEVGEYPGRDFIKVPKELTSAAPSPSRVSKKKKQVADVIKDLEDLDDTHFSSGDDDNSVIPTAPLNSRPPLRLEKKTLRSLVSMHHKFPCRTHFLCDFILD
jgi:hypothetical protein